MENYFEMDIFGFGTGFGGRLFVKTNNLNEGIFERGDINYEQIEMHPL